MSEPIIPIQESKQTNTNDKNFKIFDALSAQNLQINPFYIEIAGSITGGYLLTQLVYLFRGFSYREFYQKDKDMMERLRLTEWELRAQKKELVKRALLRVRYGKGKLSYYTINIERIIDIAVDKHVDKPIELSSRNEDSSFLETRIPRIQKRGILGTVYKETNTKETLNKDTNNNDVVDLKKIGIRERHAIRLIGKHGSEKISKIMQEMRNVKDIRNSAGYLIKTLEQGWEISKGDRMVKQKNTSTIPDVEETKVMLDERESINRGCSEKQKVVMKEIRKMLPKLTVL